MRLRPVKLPPCAVPLLGSPREWGQPAGIYVGKVHHSDARQTITCMLPSGHAKVRHETRALLVVKTLDDMWIPATWDRAMARYAAQWPASAEFQAYISTKINPTLRGQQIDYYMEQARLLRGKTRADLDSTRVALLRASYWCGRWK
jgi:hypothetical protein